MKNILVTGAAGFIGAKFVEYFVNKHPDYKVVVVDKLTYAGNMANLDKVKDKISFEKADICDFEKMKEIFDKYDINGVIHFAAESHVDNSIKNPFVFTHTNVIGTHTLLETAKQKWGEGSENKFVHISTDEVLVEILLLISNISSEKQIFLLNRFSPKFLIAKETLEKISKNCDNKKYEQFIQIPQIINLSKKL